MFYIVTLQSAFIWTTCVFGSGFRTLAVNFVYNFDCVCYIQKLTIVWIANNDESNKISVRIVFDKNKKILGDADG